MRKDNQEENWEWVVVLGRWKGHRTGTGTCALLCSPSANISLPIMAANGSSSSSRRMN